jgi:branched-chain amino acid transport system permease protein
VDQFLTFTILGLTTAAIYAVAASGLVVTYTTSGIFNFAHGAVGMMAAFVYWQLKVDWGWPTPLALIAVLLVIAPLFGALVERFIMRGIEGTTEVTKLVVSVSLLVALLSAAPILWPSDTRNLVLRGFFQPDKFEVLGVNVSYHNAITMGTAIAVAIGLRLFLYRTRTGVTMRAVVDDRPLAELNGARPSQASMLAWAIGFSLAALAGILIVDSVGLNVIPLTLLVVNAYAAAMFGRLRSLPLTFLGATVLGLAESYLIGYLPTNWTFFDQSLSGLRPAMPVFLLFLVLLAIPQVRLRGHGVQRTREIFAYPTWPGAFRNAALLIGIVALIGPLLSIRNLFLLNGGLATAIIMLSLVPLVGFGGQISLAQMSFAGIGAIVMGNLGDNGNPIGLVAAVLITAAVGVVIALPALRLTGLYLALATAAFAVFMDRMVFNQQDVFPNGSLKVPRLEIFGLDFASNESYAILLAVMFSLLGFLVVAIRRGSFGRRLQAMKDSPAACATLGMNLTLTKMSVFALSAGMAGLGGALLAGFRGTATPEQFQFAQSLPILLLAVVGGIGAVGGALMGGLSLSFALPFISDTFPRLKNIVLLAPGLIGISLGRNPNGAVNETPRAIRELRDKRAAARARPAEPEPATLGLNQPFSPDDRRMLDGELGIDEGEVELVGATRS